MFKVAIWMICIATFFNVANAEMMERAKKSLKSVDEGMARDINEF